MKCAWVLVAALGVAGCKGKASCDMSDVGAGQLAGNRDGEIWTATDAQWSIDATTMTITAGDPTGHMLTIRVFQDSDGVRITDAVSGKYPLEVSFDSGEDGTIGFTESANAGSWFNEPGGWLTILRTGGGLMEACFDAPMTNGTEDMDIEASFVADRML